MTARAGQSGMITASDYISWRATFYHDELKEMQRSIETEIREDLQCEFFDDPEDNLDEVRSMLDEFVLQVEQRQEERRVAKKRFMTRISRPALSRAFFQWKLLTRSKLSSNVMQGSGMFQEPSLPWNVRHPFSAFTSSWEGVQAFLLIYIAFTVLWRLCFNQPSVEGEFYYYLEIFIDIYFSIDVILNFHTAFCKQPSNLHPFHLYTGTCLICCGLLVLIDDTSGDLKGVKVGGSGQGTADYKSLYSHYLRRWVSTQAIPT